MINIDPQVIHDKILEVGEAWAEADKQANIAEDAYKHTLNEKIQLIRNKPGESIAMNDAESRARASEEVRNAAQRRSEARGEANAARVRYDAAKIWFEAMRTKAATLRQEMHLGSSTR